MNITITKEDFERAVSVATSAQVEVFEKMDAAIKKSTSHCEGNILGNMGAEAVDKGGATLVSTVKTYICLDAFIHSLKQLDLVLTPTGFGVVANNTTSPASKARVDALEDSLIFERETAYGTLLDICRGIKGWGSTEQAKNNIRTPFYSVLFVNGYGTKEDFDQYRKMEQIIIESDVVMRKMIGNEQMDDIMNAIRNKSSDVVYCDAARMIREYTMLMYWNSPVLEDKKRSVLSFIESNPETFKIYMKSNEYKANHYEGFKNSKDKKGYFFVG